MAHRLKTPEPVFGIIRSVFGFNQLSKRGLDKARGEWNLVTMAWMMKRMFTLKHAARGKMQAKTGRAGRRTERAHGAPDTRSTMPPGTTGEATPQARILISVRHRLLGLLTRRV
jgi:hypothetical protein